MFSISCCGILPLLMSFLRLLKLHLRKSILPRPSPAQRRNGVLSVFYLPCFFNLRILPFSSGNENAAACQADRLVCACMVSCIFTNIVYEINSALSSDDSWCRIRAFLLVQQPCAASIQNRLRIQNGKQDESEFCLSACRCACLVSFTLGKQCRCSYTCANACQGEPRIPERVLQNRLCFCGAFCALPSSASSKGNSEIMSNEY